MSEPSSQPDPILELAEQWASLNNRAILVYAPIVSDIVDGSSADTQLIESTLDGLLGFAGTEEGLRLYRKLCRYNWDLDPEATASYVGAYREMWDEDSASS